MKKIILLFATCCLMLSAQAYDFESDGIYYNITSSSSPYTVEATYKTTSFNSYSGIVIIPESVTNGSITYSVTAIDDSTFNNCTSLDSVLIPSTVTYIGNKAFYKCTSLASVDLPDGLDDLGTYAFAYCSELDSVTIPGGVTLLRNRAFYKCTGLKKVTFLDGVLNIAYMSFAYCTSLEELVIPASVITIGQLAFEYCSSLVSVDLPNSVKNIQGAAFGYCTSLSSITIPDSVTSIGQFAFGGCTSLEKVIIPEGFTTIGIYSFKDCSSLGNITLPESLKTIEKSAFENCSSLKSVTIPAAVTSLVRYAFRSCDSLMEINVDAANTTYSSIDGVLFKDNEATLYGFPAGKSGSYTIPSSVTSVSFYSFYDCVNLTSLTIPRSVTYIGEYTFHNCTGLDTIYAENTTPDSITLGISVFDEVDKDSCILIVPVSSKSLYANAAQWKYFDNIYSDEPIINSTAPTTGTVGTIYTYTVEAFDINGDVLTFTLENAPDGMSISENVITWTPSNGTTTSDLFTLNVSDGTYTAIEEIEIAVSGNIPVITSTAPTSAVVGTEYSYAVAASDADGDNLSFVLSNAPDGMIITDTIITWTPVDGTSTSGEVTLTVNDGSLSTTENFTITVTGNTPIISSTAPTSATVGVEYTYTVVASDPDNDDLVYALSGAPTGMTNSGNIITWTPAEGTTTSGEVTLMVTDGSLSATEKFTITVSENTNVAPVITSTAPTTASVGTEYTYTVTASDADGDALTYTLTNAPDGMSISENVITWTPASGTTTSGEVTITVSDGSLSATEQFTITVSENSGTSVADVTNENISLYPNPVSSVLTIKSNHTIENLQLISVSGAAIRSEKVSNSETSLDMQSLQNGIYLLKINTSEGSIIKRIVKQ